MLNVSNWSVIITRARSAKKNWEVGEQRSFFGGAALFFAPFSFFWGGGGKIHYWGAAPLPPSPGLRACPQYDAIDVHQYTLIKHLPTNKIIKCQTKQTHKKTKNRPTFGRRARMTSFLLDVLFVCKTMCGNPRCTPRQFWFGLFLFRISQICLNLNWLVLNMSWLYWNWFGQHWNLDSLFWNLIRVSVTYPWRRYLYSTICNVEFDLTMLNLIQLNWIWIG